MCVNTNDLSQFLHFSYSSSNVFSCILCLLCIRSFVQSVFKRYHSDKHLQEFLPTRWRQKSTGIDMEQNYVTDTLCSLLYFAVLRLCTCFYLNFSGHLLGWVLPLGVLSALYMYHVYAFVLLLFNVDK